MHKAQKRGTARTAKKPVKKPVRKAARKPATKPRAQEAAIHVQGHENVFRGLDRNGDGFISRKEWPAEKQSFDAVDKNDDGRISPSELRSRQL